DVLIRQVRQLSRIVEDLVDVSRIIAKKIELRKERVELGAIVDTALETCRSLMEGRRPHPTVSMPPEPPYLDADPVRLSQVLINLLNNAGKFTEPGGRIRVSAERINGEALPDGATKGGQLVLRVRDNGVGIRADLMPNIFDMFTQGGVVLKG